jgi:hypothetical protein
MDTSLTTPEVWAKNAAYAILEGIFYIVTERKIKERLFLFCLM